MSRSWKRHHAAAVSAAATAADARAAPAAKPSTGMAGRCVNGERPVTTAGRSSSSPQLAEREEPGQRGPAGDREPARAAYSSSASPATAQTANDSVERRAHRAADAAPSPGGADAGHEQ